LDGADNKNNISISQISGGDIVINEYFPMRMARHILRRSYILNKNGQKELVLQRWIDEKGEEKRLFTKTPKGNFIFEREGNSLLAVNADTKSELWRKTFDTTGNLVEFQKGQIIYKFADDSSKKGFHIVTRITSEGKKEKSLPEDTFNRLIEKL
jgi:hypothetical protein